jgi:endoglucanase
VGFVNIAWMMMVLLSTLTVGAEMKIYRDEEVSEEANIYCYSVAESEEGRCLRMHIRNNNHFRPTYAIPEERWVYCKPGHSICFRIRSDRLIRSDYPLLLVLGWGQQSLTQPVMDHLFVDEEGGVKVHTIGREYVMCRIPLPDHLERFRTFRLMYDRERGEVEEALFFVDDISVIHDQGLRIEEAQILSPRHVMFTINQQPDFVSARELSRHTLRDDDGRSLRVQRVGLRSWVTGFVEGAPIRKHYIYLELTDAEVFEVGGRYHYTTRTLNDAGLLPDEGSFSFVFDVATASSPTIKVNQVGYLPEARKVVYVGNYLGDLGEMPVMARKAVLVAEDNRVVHEMSLTRRPEGDLFRVAGTLKPFSGEEVWVGDFSSVTDSGRYCVLVPGIGRSDWFEIGPRVYNEVYYHTARTFYYQRSGTAIEEKYAGKWARPASHTAPARYHNSVRDLSGKLYDPEIEPEIGGPIDLSGGWYDAADYNKYTHSAAEAVNCLLSFYELAPERFAGEGLNIPESGNGVPDLLDQVKWELDWLAKMVSANGAVFNKCSFPGFAFMMPQERTEDMWATMKTTRDTAYACAALAKGARVFREAEVFPEAVALYEQKARLAWACLLKHPESYPLPSEEVSLYELQHPRGDGIICPDIRTGPYYQEPDDRMARAWAALEIYLLMDDEAALKTFYALVDGRSDEPLLKDIENMVVDRWWHGGSYPLRYYPLMKENRLVAQAFVRGIRRVTAAYQDGYDTWRYKTSMKSTLTSANFGGFSMSTRWATYYLLFYELLGEERYLDLARQNLDVTLGANPLSISFITGIGTRSPLFPHCKLSHFDGIDEPIPGYSIYGVAHSLPGKGSYLQIMEGAYPAYQGRDTSLNYYPTARKFVDAWEPVKMGEYVIDDLARAAVCFGYFSGSEDR